MPYDMHTHSTYSGDASLAPREIAYWAKIMELDGFSLTDHDSVEGNKEAKETAEKIGIRAVNGVEMSFLHKEDGITFDGEILGHFIDPTCPKFETIINASGESRLERDKETFFLSSKRFGFALEDIAVHFLKTKDPNRKIFCGKVGDWEKRGAPQRFYTICFMMEKKHIPADTISEAHEYVKDPKNELRVVRKKTHFYVVGEAIHNAGGTMTYAHPAYIIKSRNLSIQEFKDCFSRKILPVALEIGVNAFENYRYDHVKGFSEKESAEINAYISQINTDNGLVDGVGGSDVHRKPYTAENTDSHPSIFVEMGGHTTDNKTFENLEAIAKNKAL